MDLMKRFDLKHEKKTPTVNVGSKSVDESEAEWAKGLNLDENSQIPQTVDDIQEETPQVEQEATASEPEPDQKVVSDGKRLLLSHNLLSNILFCEGKKTGGGFNEVVSIRHKPAPSSRREGVIRFDRTSTVPERMY